MTSYINYNNSHYSIHTYSGSQHFYLSSFAISLTLLDFKCGQFSFYLAIDFAFFVDLGIIKTMSSDSDFVDDPQAGTTITERRWW